MATELVMMKREDVYNAINTLMNSLVSEYDLPKVEHDSTERRDVIRVETSAYKVRIELYKESMEQTYFNADTLIKVLKDRKTYSFRSSEVEFSNAKYEIGQMGRIIRCIFDGDYSIEHTKVFFFLNNEYMVISPNSDNPIYLLKVS